MHEFLKEHEVSESTQTASRHCSSQWRKHDGKVDRAPAKTLKRLYGRSKIPSNAGGFRKDTDTKIGFAVPDMPFWKVNLLGWMPKKAPRQITGNAGVPFGLVRRHANEVPFPTKTQAFF